MKTPEGKEEVMRPRRSVRDEDAHRSPAESEALHGNQQCVTSDLYQLITSICLSSD
ncbi:hypothetical protein MOF32_02755 [Priestia megaterium]|uniref:hypothetical protein n=1 Tax=Priestia megaterium TaxID=1404 RepID=UPI00228017D6|nr:hypothetical protein [Priestia megaterium]MCY9021875.1 hypothetical protein [Priestia megaterium]